MAHHKDAIKRIKQNAKRNARNKHFRTKMRSHVKAVRLAVANGDKDAAQDALRKATSVIHRVAGKGIIHRNQAARRISRLSAAVKSI